MLDNNSVTNTEKRERRRRARFNKDEDEILRKLVEEYGDNWEIIAGFMNGRNIRQCRDRWENFLSPGLVKGHWTAEEDDLLLSKIHEVGPKWVRISRFFPNRSDVSLKNRWLQLSRRTKFTKSLLNGSVSDPPAQSVELIDGQFMDLCFSVDVFDDTGLF